MYSVCQYDVSPETYLKSIVLTQGVVFSDNALQCALENNAKRQNLVYNMPLGASKERPQELIIRNADDGYETVVSCEWSAAHLRYCTSFPWEDVKLIKSAGSYIALDTFS